MANELERYQELVKSIGKAGVHYLFPNDFEYYSCSIELTRIKDNEEKTSDFFVFPVMPDQIQYNCANLTNIRKTVNGITILKTASFVPRDITIGGTFGRKFKFLLGNSEKVATRFQFGSAVSFTPLFQVGVNDFSASVKTGYGALKTLEKITEKASAISPEGEPYRMYIYIPALGHSWVVELMSHNFSQTMDMNMLWRYSLVFRVVSPIFEKKISNKSLLKTLAYDNVRKGMDLLFEELFQSTKGSINSSYSADNTGPRSYIGGSSDIGG